MSEHNDVPRRLMPTGGRLELLLRSALTGDMGDGPYLWIIRNEDDATFRHEVKAEAPPVSRLAALALTGNDALAHAWEHGWMTIAEPTAHQLRTLMAAAVTLREIEHWADDFTGWNQARMSTVGRSRRELIERGHRRLAHSVRMEFRS